MMMDSRNTPSAIGFTTERFVLLGKKCECETIVNELAGDGYVSVLNRKIGYYEDISMEWANPIRFWPEDVKALPEQQYQFAVAMGYERLEKDSRLKALIELLITYAAPDQDPGPDPDPDSTTIADGAPVRVVCQLTGVISMDAAREIAYGAIDPNISTGPVFEVVMAAGDQHCISGSPAQGPYANEGGFEAQWSWGAKGIGEPPAKYAGTGSGKTLATGEGVDVYVLDTSPFDADSTHPMSYLKHVATDTFETPELPDKGDWLGVCHVAGLRQGARNNPAAFPHHGLCAASLVHKVAPDANVKLVRVLNSFVEGTTDVLAREIGAVTRRFIHEVKHRQRTLPVVLSLSWHVEVNSTPTRIEENEITDLKRAIQDAAKEGIIIVASAGNESRAGEEPQASEFPASLPEVIGVAASGQDGKRAWFSNLGNVMAPGCALTAMVNEYPPLSSGWTVVSGSSYAAPIVAGLVALMLEEKKRQAQGPMSLTALAGAVKLNLYDLFHEQAESVPPPPFGTAQATKVVSIPDALASCAP